MAEPRHRSLFRRIVGGFFAWFGFVVALIIVLGVVARLLFVPGGDVIADHGVITIDLTVPFPDAPPQTAIERTLLGQKLSLREVTDTIAAAAKDSRVDGIMAHVGDGDLNLAQIQELRDAIAAFRTTGKFAYAYADTFGELSGGTGAYYLASAFQEIWLQPYSDLGLVGLRAEQPFLHDTLDKIGVAPRMDHREEYKSAMNMFTETKMTPAQREETGAILQSLLGQIVRGIAQSRHMSEADARQYVVNGPYSADEAVGAKLVDHQGYRDDVVDVIRAGAQRHLLPIDKYAESITKPHNSGPAVAIIYANGLIRRGRSTDGLLDSGGALGGDTLAAAFRQAAADSSVRAILFRIDSPGGSAVASESIWQATVAAKKAGKPIIVSMGNVAGSGGYYIAASADRIVAEPATLTGSIGVVGGKFLIQGLSEKLGVSWDSIETSPNAGMLSTTEDFTPEGHRRFEKFLDDVYAGFKDRVAQGRHIDAAKVEAVAKGRVWTGEEAKANGLVDALGGFELALSLAKEAAKIPAESDVTLKQFPKEERTLLGQLLGRGEADALLSPLKPYLRMLTLLTAPAGALTMAPIEVH